MDDKGHILTGLNFGKTCNLSCRSTWESKENSLSYNLYINAMDFTRITPHPTLTAFIECYWMMYSDDPAPVTEKIIPDGFTEIIFNYRDSYQSKISGSWNLLSAHVLAGQLKTFFYLQNTGTTGSVAVKFMPAALTQLFGLRMDQYLDKITDLDTLADTGLQQLKQNLMDLGEAGVQKEEHAVKRLLDEFFTSCTITVPHNPLTKPLELIFSSNGMVPVAALSAAAGLGERQLERLFKQYIGLPPKYYMRIIRFNYIFQLIRAKRSTWTEIVYQSGYYDQSHFIRDFKAFTGEDPSAYFFEQKNMANFFLNK